MNAVTQALFTFDPVQLTQVAEQSAEAYRTADPFPCIMFDHFLPEGVLDPVLDEFPDREQAEWITFDRATEKKRISRDENQLGPYTRHLIAQFNSSTFVRFLQVLSGINGLIPDVHLVGGGVHSVEPGGFLKIHADFNLHDELRLDRRLNVLVYLNKDWQEEYGGHLELWDREMTRCAKRFLPIFNRCVIFSTTSTSWHGNPDPVKCPPGMSRKAINLYYYSNGRPEEEKREWHSTVFQRRPGETIHLSPKEFIRGLTPPFLYQGASRVYRALQPRS